MVGLNKASLIDNRIYPFIRFGKPCQCYHGTVFDSTVQYPGNYTNQNVFTMMVHKHSCAATPLEPPISNPKGIGEPLGLVKSREGILRNVSFTDQNSLNIF